MRITKSDRVSATEAKQILERHSAEHGMLVSIDKGLDMYTDLMKTVRNNIPYLRALLNNQDINATNRNTFMSSLLAYAEANSIPPSLLPTSAKKEDRLTYLESDIYKKHGGEIYTAVKKFHEASEAYTKATTIYSYLQYPIITEKDYKGSRVCQVSCEYNIAATGRVLTKNPNIQGLNRELHSIFTVLPGQVLLKFDSSQIEPVIRWSYYLPDKVIQKLIIEYKDAYFGLLHYCTMSDEELAQARADVNSLKIREIDDKMREGRKELKVLLLSVSYGASRDKLSGLGLQVYDRLTNHPLVLELDKKLKDDVFRKGVNKFYSAFGTEIVPETNEKYSNNGSTAWLNHVYRCGLNNPLQATASDLLCIAVKEIDKRIYDKFEYHPLMRIGATIHDAIYLYAPEEYELQAVDMLYDVMNYRVEIDGNEWIPIGVDDESPVFD